MLFAKFLIKRDSYAFHVARILLCALACLFSLLEANAQSVNAPIEGTVRDQTGAPVENAEVILKNAVSVISKSKTGADGHFKIDAAATQGVMLEVRAEGFASFERDFAAIQGSSGELIITLTPAPLSEQVTITATRPETRLGETAASIVALS